MIEELTTLGVTGGIGSGKTTVCRILERLGARVFYADQEAKRLMQEDESVRNALVEAFGPDTYRNGALDRAYLAGRVFNDEAELRRLNAIVHPKVFEAFEEAKETARKDGVRLLVKEAALIFESGSDRQLDYVAVVDAPEADRIARVMKRDRVTASEVSARARHQLPPEELVARADFVISNDADFKKLEQQTTDLYRKLAG